MRDGYTAVVNPNNDIAELDSNNNSFIVEGTAKLRLVWAAGYAGSARRVIHWFTVKT